MKDKEYLVKSLASFNNIEYYYSINRFYKGIMSDGVQFLKDEFDAYWLVDLIESLQKKPQVKKELFQIWRLKINDDKTGTIVATTKQEELILERHIGFVEFPSAGITIWRDHDLLLLPNEYR